MLYHLFRNFHHAIYMFHTTAFSIHYLLYTYIGTKTLFFHWFAVPHHLSNDFQLLFLQEHR